MDHTIVLPEQLKTHLRSLRKARGVTQAELGAVLGVGQARVAEIESDPTAIRVDQLLKILSFLRVQVKLHDTGEPVIHRPLVPRSPPRRKSVKRDDEALRTPLQGPKVSANDPAQGAARQESLRQTTSKRTRPAKGRVLEPRDAKSGNFGLGDKKNKPTGQW
jgi:HTH-type transcriptional regulator/antitoxin HipB